jgi:hypothetical protein
VLGYLRGYGYFVGEIYSAITTRFTSWLSVQSNVEVHARDGTRTYKPNPSKEELNHHKIKMKSWPRTMMRCQRKQVKKGRRKKKKVAKKVHESEDDSKKPAAKIPLDEDDTSVAKRNKYRYDDDSCRGPGSSELWSRSVNSWLHYQPANSWGYDYP